MKKLILLFVVGMTGLAASPVSDGYQVGDTITDFKLKNVDGKMISLADFKNAKGFIIIFDCNTCPMSRAYNPRIIALNKKFASQGFPVVLINPNAAELVPEESFDEMKNHAKEHGYDFPYLYDESQEVVRKFNPTNTPHTFVLNKTSNGLKVAYIGAIDNNSRDGSKATKHFVEEAVNELLAGKPVTVTKTKAIGCTVKLKNS
ncbi:MAG TPA: thioredoxin family protein [Cyclobacteriaceae bacterium]|nr:thioredoxin family protein [Cyclobacteriaceae bacterium]